MVSYDKQQRNRAMFNGHENWDHWNVSLWINNDEGLYNMVLHYARRPDREQAILELLNDLPTHTPDGAPYTADSVREAMEDMT